ncbi:MAG: antibiotic biosynthesis monooxygenase [Planctomyces sp.]|nr:antibiotic biosynthesis monooxygenase [Planctomyces sp.]
MAHLAIRHRVRDYVAWKRVFDEFAPQRRAAGEIDYQIFDVDGDRNHIAIIQEWTSLENAKAFISSDALKEAMGKAGVEGEPTILFLNAGDSGKP